MSEIVMAGEGPGVISNNGSFLMTGHIATQWLALVMFEQRLSSRGVTE